MSQKRIALFQSRHTLQVHTAFLVSCLQEAGYVVEVFLYRCSPAIFHPRHLGTVVHDLTPPGVQKERPGRLSRWRGALEEFFIFPVFGSESDCLGKGVLQETIRRLGNNQYHCYIGIEKMGLVWAGLIAQRIPAPVIYQSYELYSGKYLRTISPLKWLRFLRVRSMERKYHQACKATIIQDEMRAEILRRTNRHRTMVALCVPIGLRGSSLGDRSDFLQKRFPQLRGKIVLLQFGLIEDRRFSTDLVQFAQDFPQEWALVLHGRFERETLGSLRRRDKKNKVVFSDQLVGPEELNDLIASAGIGLCFYSDQTLNEYTAGFSSEKLARYLKCGVPVIAFNYPSFLASVEHTGSGICISDLSQLSQAVHAIQDNYEKYRAGAQKAYEQHFRLDAHFQKVVRFLDELV